MKLKKQTYIAVLIMIAFCLNAVNAVNIHQLKPSSRLGDTLKIAKIADLKDKIKLTHKSTDNQIRIETDFPAAESLTAEIINMIGVSCQKTNFRANTTVDYTLKPGIYFVVVYLNKQRIYTSKILVSQ